MKPCLGRAKFWPFCEACHRRVKLCSIKSFEALIWKSKILTHYDHCILWRCFFIAVLLLYSIFQTPMVMFTVANWWLNAQRIGGFWAEIVGQFLAVSVHDPKPTCRWILQPLVFLQHTVVHLDKYIYLYLLPTLQMSQWKTSVKMSTTLIMEQKIGEIVFFTKTK